MKKLILIAILCILNSSVFAQNNTEKYKVLQKQLSALKLKDMYNQDVSIRDYTAYRDGILVNVWATWCTPCVQELPSLEKLQYKMPNISVVAISIDRHEKIVKNFLKRSKVSSNYLTFLLDHNGSKLKDIGIKQVPTTILLDNKGNVLEIINGARKWDSMFMMSSLNAQLKKGN